MQQSNVKKIPGTVSFHNLINKTQILYTKMHARYRKVTSCKWIVLNSFCKLVDNCHSGYKIAINIRCKRPRDSEDLNDEDEKNSSTSIHVPSG